MLISKSFIIVIANDNLTHKRNGIFNLPFKPYESHAIEAFFQSDFIHLKKRFFSQKRIKIPHGFYPSFFLWARIYDPRHHDNLT